MSVTPMGGSPARPSLTRQVQPSAADASRLPEARRREILAKLAAERSERRGFASDREIALQLAAAAEAEAAAGSASPRSPVDGRPANEANETHSQSWSPTSTPHERFSASSALAHRLLSLPSDVSGDHHASSGDVAVLAGRVPTPSTPDFTDPPARRRQPATPPSPSPASARSESGVADLAAASYPAAGASAPASNVGASTSAPASALTPAAKGLPVAEPQGSADTLTASTGDSSPGGGVGSAAKAARDALVARLLAEREARKRGEIVTTAPRSPAVSSPGAVSSAPSTSSPAGATPADGSASPLVAQSSAPLPTVLGSSTGGAGDALLLRSLRAAVAARLCGSLSAPLPPPLDHGANAQASGAPSPTGVSRLGTVDAATAPPAASRIPQPMGRPSLTRGGGDTAAAAHTGQQAKEPVPSRSPNSAGASVAGSTRRDPAAGAAASSPLQPALLGGRRSFRRLSSFSSQRSTQPASAMPAEAETRPSSQRGRAAEPLPTDAPFARQTASSRSRSARGGSSRPSTAGASGVASISRPHQSREPTQLFHRARDGNHPGVSADAPQPAPRSRREPNFERLHQLAYTKLTWTEEVGAARRAKEEAEFASACTFQPNVSPDSVIAEIARQRSGRSGSAGSRDGDGLRRGSSAAAGVAYDDDGAAGGQMLTEEVFVSWDGSMARAFREAPPPSAVVAAAGESRGRQDGGSGGARLTVPGERTGATRGLAPFRKPQREASSSAPPAAKRHVAAATSTATMSARHVRAVGTSRWTPQTAAARLRSSEPAWRSMDDHDGERRQAVVNEEQQHSRDGGDVESGGGHPVPVIVPSWARDPPSFHPHQHGQRMALATRVEDVEAAEARRLAASAARAAASRLYAEADSRAIARARRKAELEQARLSQCTFAPRINSASERLAESVGRGPGGARLPLHQRTAEIQRRRAESLARARVEAVTSHADLTFKPRISEASARMATARSKAAGLPVAGEPAEDYFIADGQDAGGSPGSGSGGGGTSTAPLAPFEAATARLSRAAEDAARRKAARAAAAARAEAERCTFQPRISERSERLAAARAAEVEAAATGEDLVAGVLASSAGHADDASAPGGRGRRRHSVAGSVSTRGGGGGFGCGTSVSPSLAGGGGGMTRFLARQRAMAELSEAERRRTLAEDASRARNVCTFSPDIGNADEVLALTRPAQATESEAQRLERLYRGDARAVADARARVSEGYYAQFKYAPAIDPVSRAVGRARTVDEHYRNAEGVAARARAGALAESEFRERHPFRPTLVASDPSTARQQQRRGSKDSTASGNGGIDAGSSVVSGTTSGNPYRLAVASDPEALSARIAALRAAKEAHIERLRRQAEYESLKECTFAPETNGGRVPLSSAHLPLPEEGGEEVGGEGRPAPPVVVVRGLGRHLELRELSRRLDAEQR